jgi:hypothetical protein
MDGVAVAEAQVEVVSVEHDTPWQRIIHHRLR